MSDTSIFMFLTRSCNLACSHCYVSAEPRLKGHMSLDVFRQIVESFSVQGINDFRLTGGEPTIHPNFEELLEILNSKRITPRLITNGIWLMQMRSPETVLNRVSKCWISTYGISLRQHRMISGERSPSLKEIMDFAGQQTKAGHWVGVSALLTEASLDALKDFVELARKCGVRYLRFLFGEPSGRAVLSHTVFSYGDHARDQAIIIVDYLRHYVATTEAFDFLSINNPFDLEPVHGSVHASCMLLARRMWSVSPEGNIYSCCFNVYNPAHLVPDTLLSDGLCTLSNKELTDIYAPRCEGLGANYWSNGNGGTTCPISALTLIS